MDWIQKEKKYIFQTYRRQPLVLVKARGSAVWDIHGKKYLDFFSGLGVNNLGHCHPKVIRAAAIQLKKLLHTSNLYYTLPQIQCAELLIKKTFDGRVFFSNSGAEANECALKLARRWGNSSLRYPSPLRGEGVGEGGSKIEIIAFENSFHGRTLGTLSLTGQEKYRKGFEPFLPKVVFAKFNEIRSVQSAFSKKTCAVIIEPVQGEGGVVPAEKKFLQGLRKMCNDKKALLIFDEVQCGLGRTGKLFAFQHFGVVPDILTIAKGLGGGLPIGATVVKKQFAHLLGAGDHASTFGGNPVCCAAASEVLKTLTPTLLQEVKANGEFFLRELTELKKKFPSLVQEVRGIGLMLGLELKISGNPIVDFCREKGLLMNCTQEKVLRFLPPLTASKKEITTTFTILKKALQKI